MSFLAILKRLRGQILAAVIVAILFSGGIVLVRGWLEKPGPKTQRVVQEIALVRPPPPPPEVEEPPPPPEMEEEIPELPEPQSEPDPVQSDDPPPSDLGLDAEGVAGSDAFGLVGNRGGRGIIGSGGGSRYRWYAGVLKQTLVTHLADYEQVRSASYVITVDVYINQRGRVVRVELTDSTGDPELDMALQQALSSLSDVGGPPPDGLPQPVKLRIESRL